jgi:hypothetical protein
VQRQFDGLLMMGIIMPETCWAVSVWQNNKILWLIVASSWVFYLSDWRCTEPQTLKTRVHVFTYVIRDNGLWTVWYRVIKKFSVHLMITIQKVTSNVRRVLRQSPDIYWHAELCCRRPCSV